MAIQLNTRAFAEQVVREYTTFDWTPRDNLSVPMLRFLDLAQAYLKLVNKRAKNAQRVS